MYVIVICRWVWAVGCWLAFGSVLCGAVVFRFLGVSSGAMVFCLLGGDFGFVMVVVWVWAGIFVGLIFG